MDMRLSRSIPPLAGLFSILLLTTSCESWFGPAEGDGIRAVTPSTIEIVAGECCGAEVRLDGGPIQRVKGHHRFTNLAAGEHTVAVLNCEGSCPGLWGGGYCNCEDQWRFCKIDLYQGGHATIDARGVQCY